MLERKTLSVGGILLSYLASGSGTKGALIFLHGWRSNADVWRGTIEGLADSGYTLYALDLPGFGNSEAPREPFSVYDYAKVVKDFAGKVGVVGAAIIGHSFGGRVGIVLAAKDPQLVKKLVLVGSAGIRTESLRRMSIGFIAKLLRPIFAPRFMRGARKRLYMFIGAGDYLETPELRETFKLVIAEDLQPLLPKITAETLLVWGENDKETPLSYAETMQRGIPRAKLVLLKNAGHFSFLEESAEFLKALKSFVA